MLAAAVLAAGALVWQAQPLEEAIADLVAGRLAEAERKFSALLAGQPESEEANFYLGIVKFRTGQLQEARPLLEKAVKLAPERAGAWKGLGAVYAAAGELERSLLCFQRACELNPQEEDACYYLGRNLYSLNRFEPALGALQKALKAGPETKLWRVHRSMAQAQEALGRAEEAEKSFREAVRLDRGQARPDEDPRIDFGLFLFRQGRTEEALAPLEDAVKAHPSSARAHGELGRVLLQLGRLEPAAGALEKTVRLDPKLWSAHLLLGRVYLRLGRTEESERHLRLGEQGLAAEGYGASRPR